MGRPVVVGREPVGSEFCILLTGVTPLFAEAFECGREEWLASLVVVVAVAARGRGAVAPLAVGLLWAAKIGLKERSGLKGSNISLFFCPISRDTKI